MPKKVAKLACDGADYSVLIKACQSTWAPGLTCEIGVRAGGSSALIMQHMPNRTHVAVDPYGMIPYYWSEDNRFAGKSGLRHATPYPNALRDETIPLLYTEARNHGVNFLYFCLEDTEFFKRFADGVPVYRNTSKLLINDYALVYIDGPHNLVHVQAATEFFAPRCGGCLVYDNVDSYDHPKIEAQLYGDFEMLATDGVKSAYRKKEPDKKQARDYVGFQVANPTRGIHS